MWQVEAREAFCEDFAARVGDANRMFKLRRQGAVPRHRRPAIFQNLAIGPADIDHGFNGEEHARLQLWPRAGAADMDNFGCIMK